ncbi:hypothetical protein CSUI_008669, partial [Cystoisospora suis]
MKEERSRKKRRKKSRTFLCSTTPSFSSSSTYLERGGHEKEKRGEEEEGLSTSLRQLENAGISPVSRGTGLITFSISGVCTPPLCEQSKTKGMSEKRRLSPEGSSSKRVGSSLLSSSFPSSPPSSSSLPCPFSNHREKHKKKEKMKVCETAKRETSSSLVHP